MIAKHDLWYSAYKKAGQNKAAKNANKAEKDKALKTIEQYEREAFYRKWAKSAEALAINAPPSMGFLLIFPDEFKDVLKEFNVAYFTYQMLDA